MEDKQFLDEAGLGEVGKVISKFYASKDDIKDLDSLKDFVASHNEIKLHYITQEEYDEMSKKGEYPLLSDIYDPISIVGIEAPANYFNVWEDDPWRSQLGSGLNPESRYSDGGQKYLLFNITPDHEIINENVDDAQFNQTPLKKHNIRLQIALGERDQCLYWRLLNDSDEGVEWTYIQDPYSRLFLKIHERRIDGLIKQLQDKADKSELPTKLSQLQEDENHRTVTDKEKEKWNNKVDKIVGKGLSTHDYTSEDKKKLDSIDVEAINSADNSNVNTIKFCDVEKEILSKGVDAPIGFYIDNTQISSALKTYRIFIDEETQNKSYRVEVLLLNYDISRPIAEEYLWQNDKWEKCIVAPSITEPNSISYAIIQLQDRIEKLESKVSR